MNIHCPNAVGGGCGNGEERVEPEKPSFVSLGQAYLRSGQFDRAEIAADH
jgi:hypothetical protein